jgi:hypothetical protein
VSRRSRRALARSTAGQRLVFALLGLVLLVGGVLGVLVGLGVFGEPRSTRPLVDPIALGFLRSHPLAAPVVAVAVGLVLVLVGLAWALRGLRPEPRPDLMLESTGEVSLRVRSSAAAAAVVEDAEGLPGVGRARARLVGRPGAPALRMTLWLGDGADVRTIWRELEDGVLSRLRESLGIRSLPTAIRLELDRSADRTRVS